MIDSDLPPFPGFRKEAFDFFRQLVRNNDRDWFKPRKSIYDDEVVWPMQCLLAEASREARQLGMQLFADPKRSLFRIYRDTRFSKNKDPYKTHAGAVLTRDGTHKSMGGVYIHVEPERPMMAAGFWHPDNTFLRVWRTTMSDNPPAFLEMVDRLKAQGLDVESDESLKRMPAGFDGFEGHAIAPYLRFKSYTTWRALTEEVMQRPDFTRDVVRMMQDCYPLLEYGWMVEERTG